MMMMISIDQWQREGIQCWREKSSLSFSLPPSCSAHKSKDGERSVAKPHHGRPTAAAAIEMGAAAVVKAAAAAAGSKSCERKHQSIGEKSIKAWEWGKEISHRKWSWGKKRKKIRAKRTFFIREKLISINLLFIIEIILDQFL